MRGKNPPTAIIFNNDAMALGGCKALVEMGVKPGKDVAVIVIVDTALCRYFSPALTGFRPALGAARPAVPKCCLPPCRPSPAPRARKSSAKSGRWN